MALFMRKTLVALKKETVYGTPETLTGTECFLIRNASLTPLAGATASRDFVRPYFGNSSTIQLDQHYELTFELELQSSGTAGTRPAYGDALLACGFDETIAAGSATYDPLSEAFDSVTIAVYMDGILHTMAGARGSFSLNLARGALPILNFTFWGAWTAPVDDTPLTPDFSDFKIPLGPNSTNTPTVTLFSEAVCMESLQVDIANQLVHRDLPGCTPNTLITNRAPAGTIVFEHTLVDTYDWISAAKNKTIGALQVVHGTSAGYICQIDAPAVSLNPPSYSDSDGIIMLNAPIVLEPTSAGNDELKLTFK